MGWVESKHTRSTLARQTFSAPAESQVTYPIFPSPRLDLFAICQLHTRGGSGLDTASPERACRAQAHTSNPHWQIHTTTMSPAAARPFLPGRHTNIRDAGDGRSPWFFLQLQRHDYTKCLCKRHPTQNRLDRNRRATETILACSTDEIPFKSLRWSHSSTSLFDSLLFITWLFVKLTVP